MLTYPVVFSAVLAAFFLGIHLGVALYKRNAAKNKRVKYEEIIWLYDNIKSCGTFAELQTCSDWAEKISYEMEPAGVEYLKVLLGKKMIELERMLSKHKGNSEGGVQ